MKFDELNGRKDLNLNDALMTGDTIIKGKTKIIQEIYYKGAKVEDAVFITFGDDITAGDGAKHDTIKDKSVIDWCTNANIFEYLNRMGVKTHYLCSPKKKVSIVKKLDQKINLEVVTRRVATGSILKHTNLTEGKHFRPLYTQFFYKDDFLHDPLLDREFIIHLKNNKQFFMYNKMVSENCLTFCILEKAFAQFGVQLIDMKLEYGMLNGEVILIDEITGGSFRLWPYAEGVTKINWISNVLGQLNPKGRLDKDLYRKGEATLEGIKTKFQEIAAITAQFKSLTNEDMI